MRNILEVSNVSKSYGFAGKSVKALNNVSLEISKREIVGVMGPSGAGKTTLLNVVSTIDKPTEGMIRIGQKELSRMNRREISEFRSRSLGFIFQDYNLLDTLTIGENISLPLTISGHGYKEVKKRVNDASKTLGIAQLLDKFPHECSGGEKQRAAAVRAVIHNPELILADEPTGALDSKSTIRLLHMMASMRDEMDASIMMVTHDPNVASYCDRVYFISDGEVFNQISKGHDQNVFFNEIQNVISTLGGHYESVL